MSVFGNMTVVRDSAPSNVCVLQCALNVGCPQNGRGTVAVAIGTVAVAIGAVAIGTAGLIIGTAVVVMGTVVVGTGADAGFGFFFIVRKGMLIAPEQMPNAKRNHAHQGQPPPSVVVVVATVTGAGVVVMPELKDVPGSGVANLGQ